MANSANSKAEKLYELPHLPLPPCFYSALTNIKMKPQIQKI